MRPGRGSAPCWGARRPRPSEESSRRVTRLGAIALASSLALGAVGVVQADDVPAAQRSAVTNHHLAVLAVEGMT